MAVTYELTKDGDRSFGLIIFFLKDNFCFKIFEG